MYKLRWLDEPEYSFSGSLEEIRDHINTKRGCNLKHVLPGLGGIPNRDFYEWVVLDPDMRMKLWDREKYYIGKDYSDYFVLIGHTRDSDARQESNFHTAVDLMGGESKTVQVVRFDHWMCGWVEGIFIHKSDQDAIDKAEEILAMLEQYQVLDEEDYAKTQIEMGEEDER